MEKNIKFDCLSDIFFLSTGEKQNLQISGVSNIFSVYAEAYSLDIVVDVMVNQPLDVLLVVLVKEPKPRHVANQLVHTLYKGEESTVSYGGDLPSAGLRTAIYNCAKKLGIRVRINETFGILYVSKPANHSSLEMLLESMNVGDNIQVPVTLHTSVERLRAAISNYGRRHNLSFKTRLVGDNLSVTAMDAVQKVKTGDVRQWLMTTPWDMQLDIPEFDGTTQQSLITSARRLFGCTVSFKGGKMTKNSFATGVEGSARIVRVRGHVIYSAFCDKFSETDIRAINEILSFHNKTYEDLV